jgi:hypothetical protein
MRVRKILLDVQRKNASKCPTWITGWRPDNRKLRCKGIEFGPSSDALRGRISIGKSFPG